MISAEEQEALRRRFNPDGSALRRHQMRMLEMLRLFDDYCARHGVRYWLSSGTCIGAMRHGGFIPWDDDVDVEMSTRDFRKLRHLVAREPIDGLDWQDSSNEKFYPQPFAKLRDPRSEMREPGTLDNLYLRKGIYVDVFAVAPSNSRFLAICGAKIQNILVYRVAASQRLRPLLPFTKFLAHGLLLPAIEKLASVGAGQRLRHRPGTAFHAPRYRRHVSDIVRVPFEGITLPVPALADEYLRAIYGDYTHLPDLDRIPVHTDSASIVYY